MATCIRKWAACSIKHGAPDVLRMENSNLFHPWLIKSLPGTLKHKDGTNGSLTGCTETALLYKDSDLRFTTSLAKLLQVCACVRRIEIKSKYSVNSIFKINS